VLGEKEGTSSKNPRKVRGKKERMHVQIGSKVEVGTIKNRDLILHRPI